LHWLPGIRWTLSNFNVLNECFTVDIYLFSCLVDILYILYVYEGTTILTFFDKRDPPRPEMLKGFLATYSYFYACLVIKLKSVNMDKKTFFCKIPMFSSQNTKLDANFDSYLNTTTCIMTFLLIL
jgi:hypothetical protein